MDLDDSDGPRRALPDGVEENDLEEEIRLFLRRSLEDLASEKKRVLRVACEQELKPLETAAKAAGEGAQHLRHTAEEMREALQEIERKLQDHDRQHAAAVEKVRCVKAKYRDAATKLDRMLEEDVMIRSRRPLSGEVSRFLFCRMLVRISNKVADMPYYRRRLVVSWIEPLILRLHLSQAHRMLHRYVTNSQRPRANKSRASKMGSRGDRAGKDDPPPGKKPRTRIPSYELVLGPLHTAQASDLATRKTAGKTTGKTMGTAAISSDRNGPGETGTSGQSPLKRCIVAGMQSTST